MSKLLLDQFVEAAENYGWVTTTEAASEVPEWVEHCADWYDSPEGLTGESLVFRKNGTCLAISEDSYGVYHRGPQLLPDHFETAILAVFGDYPVNFQECRFGNEVVHADFNSLDAPGVLIRVYTQEGDAIVKMSLARSKWFGVEGKGWDVLTAKMLEESPELISQVISVMR
jgi:hypothetical protein